MKQTLIFFMLVPYHFVCVNERSCILDLKNWVIVMAWQKMQTLYD
jgi:hypothetical protein